MATNRKAPRKPVNEAAVLDFEAFLGKFERPTFTRQLMQKAGLLPELTERSRVLDEIEKRIEMLEKVEDEKERSITDVSPLAELQSRREKLTLEYNDLANEYNASAVSFTFRIPDQEGDKEKIEALLVEADLTPPEKPDESLEGDGKAAAMKVWEKDFEAWWNAATLRSMSVTCTSHKFTVAQWEALQAHVGLLAFGDLKNAWAEAVQAATPTVPFSLRPLHTREPEE
jgi:hypothetical protein